MNIIMNWGPYGVWAICLVALLVMAVKIYKRNKGKHPAPTEEDFAALEYSEQQEMLDKWPKCPCGDLATHTAPQLVRSRTGFLQAFFAMPPRYRRVVKKVKVRDDCVFCETHAHVADAMMDRFIYNDVRNTQAETNKNISILASTFEKEGLVEQIRDTLTEKQKRATRRPPPLIVLPKPTGTDEASPASES